MITQARLKELLSYDPDTGEFRWRELRCGRALAGARAGCLRAGYRFIRTDGRGYPEHQLAWLYMTGEFPPKPFEVDHRNLIKSDNRWENLRLATRSQNVANNRARTDNKLGVKGVYPCGRRFRADVRKNGQVHYLGLFDTIEAAQAAHRSASAELFGEFART